MYPLRAQFSLVAPARENQYRSIGSLNKSLHPHLLSIQPSTFFATLTSLDARVPLRRPFSLCPIPRTVPVGTPKGYSQSRVSVPLTFEMTWLTKRGVTLQQPPRPKISSRPAFCSRTLGRTANTANSLSKRGAYVDAK